MKICLSCTIPTVRMDAREVHRQATSWISLLLPAHEEFQNWWVVPDGPKDPFVPLGDAETVISSIQSSDRAFYREFPDAESDGSTGVLLTNAGSEKQWRERGKVFLSIKPTLGRVTLEISRLEEIYASPGALVWSLLKGLSSDARVTFANTNVMQNVAGELLLYSYSRAVYKHREFLGWMGYVDSPILPGQLPDSAILESQRGGTLILATELLDLADPRMVEQVNRVEMSLAELGLLPVIDPTAM